MNVIQKSEAIKNGLRKGFQDGSSKMAKRKNLYSQAFEQSIEMRNYDHSHSR